MKRKMYTLPLQLGRITEKQQHSECQSLEQSIRQNIHLLLMTHVEEYRFDHSYGCKAWENEFEILSQVSDWKEIIERSVEEAVTRHEKRLTKVRVDVDIELIPFEHPKDNTVRRAKKRIKIEISGLTINTNMPFHHQSIMYFSPISLD